MKIGIDASRAFIEEKTGVEEYSYQLIKNLAMMDTLNHQIFLYVEENSKIDFDIPDNFFIKEIKGSVLRTQVGLSLEMKKSPVDILFVPSYTIPIIHPQKTVVTVHGLEYKRCPQCYSLRERAILEINTLLSVRWSSKIIVPSENTKNDLIKFYKVCLDKIEVVYHGTKGVRRQASGVRRQNKKSFNILFIGRLEKRKNLVALIKAFEIFKNSSKFQVPSSKLILAGKQGFGFEEINQAIQRSPFKGDIVLEGYVSEEEKEELYKKADLFVLPSFYEGFGFPVLEAMSHGMPVVCSNISSLPEVAGSSALLVNPNSTEEIAKAIEQVYHDEDLRNDIIEKGLKNVKKFSWEKCVDETLETLTKMSSLD
jgi:glycosyltransferase involved in cell wall biosynthesis